MPPPDEIDFNMVGASEAMRHMDELTDLYREVYAEPPYEWDEKHAELFNKRFAGHFQNEGFSLVEARDSSKLIAFGFGVPLAPTTPWWQNLVTGLPEEVTREYVGRTFALVELLVRRPWRRRYVAETIHARLLQNRHEERATLTVLPVADAAQAAYVKWGWHKVVQKRNPLPGSPVSDVMVRGLGTSAARSHR